MAGLALARGRVMHGRFMERRGRTATRSADGATAVVTVAASLGAESALGVPPHSAR